MDKIQIEMSDDYEHRLIFHIKELLRDGRVLYNAKSRKRALLLTLTALEECSKLEMLKNDKAVGAFNHKHKFRELNDVLKMLIKKVLPEAPSRLVKFASDFPEGDRFRAFLEDTAIAIHTENVTAVDAIVEFIMKFLSAEEIRKRLMYEDKAKSPLADLIFNQAFLAVIFRLLSFSVRTKLYRFSEKRIEGKMPRVMAIVTKGAEEWAKTLVEKGKISGQGEKSKQ